ncbi:MAG TPA: hypothetical protein VF712_01420 [Thermoleophilaceae bacterium]
MQVRRAIVASVLVFAAVTLIAALAAPREPTGDLPASAQTDRRAPLQAVTVAFRHPVEAEPPVRTVRGGTHVVVRVQAAVAGDVELAGLGLIEPVAPGTPAELDVLATRSGRFDVNLRSVAGERTRLGTLAVGG